MSNVFITGGAGFIGTHLVKRLAPDHTVTVYDNCTTNALERLGYDRHKNVTVIKGDILDVDHLLRSMEGADVVIHAAALVGVDAVTKDQLNTIKTNVFGTYNVLDAARHHAVPGRVIVFSTSEIFGQMAYKVRETDPVLSGPPGEPRWGYGISKVAGEHLANAYHSRFGLPTVCVRPFNIYGPGQTMNGAMKMFIHKALQHEDITINGDGSPIRAWCYIDDFVDCILRCMTHPGAINESFNIGNAKTAITVLNLAQKIIRLLESPSQIHHGNPLATEIHLRIPCVDKAKEVLGFEAQIDLDTGILKTAESVRQELLLGSKKPVLAASL